MNVQAAIFDLEGVLVVTKRIHLQAWMELCRQEALDFRSRDAMDGSDAEILERILVANDTRVKESERADLLRRKHALYESGLDNLENDDFYPGAMGFVMELRNHGVSTAIGSAAAGGRAIVHALGLDALFEVVVTAEGAGGGKESELYETVLSELGTSPEESVLFEDENGPIERAKSLGLRTVGVGPPDLVAAAEQRLIDFREIDLTRFISKGAVG